MSSVRCNWKRRGKVSHLVLEPFMNQFGKTYGDGWDYGDLERVAEHYNRKILVVDCWTVASDSQATTVLFESQAGSNDPARHIYLIYDRQQQHYMGCRRMSTIFRNKKWCPDCRQPRGLQNFATHRCHANKCYWCRQQFDTFQEKHNHANGVCRRCLTQGDLEPEPGGWVGFFNFYCDLLLFTVIYHQLYRCVLSSLLIRCLL